MMGPNAYRGQPLVVLGLLLGGWVVARTIMWDASALPLREAPPLPGPLAVVVEPSQAPIAHEPAPMSVGTLWSPAPPPPPQAAPVLAPRRFPAAPFFTAPPERMAPVVPARPLSREFRGAVRGRAADVVAGHQMMWMAALARLPVPASLVAYRPPQAAPLPLGSRPATAAASSPAGGAGRWSADAWLLMRRGGAASLAAIGMPGTYGASQAGGVVRYRLDPNDAHRPAAYLRTTAALNGSNEREAALGLQARPLPALPLVVAAEVRATSVPGATHLRPAAFVYSELPARELPLDMRLESYLQAGYVGGSFATAFADGQVRLDRKVTQVGPAELRAGGGLWGGAQRGASRLDVGPSATLSASGSGTAAARVGVDWRFRVAGEAVPASGPALTLSAGF